MVRTFIAGLLVFAAVGMSPCRARAAASQEIIVSAAISLQNAFEEMGKRFESRYNNVRVTFNFGASGDLVAQIRGGAPVDVFASAALKDMDTLEGDGLIVKDTRSNFASNSMVLAVPKSSKVRIASFKDLARPGIRKIAVGNPATVPAGRYANEVFDYFKLSRAIGDKLIFAENVRQVLDYVARNEVDAGAVYSTDAASRAAEVAVAAVAPEGSHRPILYPIGVVSGSKNEKAAREFVSFVRSREGERILEQYGFRPAR